MIDARSAAPAEIPGIDGIDGEIARLSADAGLEADHMRELWGSVVRRDLIVRSLSDPNFLDRAKAARVGRSIET